MVKGYVSVPLTSWCHLVVEKFHDCDEGGRSTKSGQHPTTSVTIDGVEGGVEGVNEYHVEIFVLFPTFPLDLPGHKDHPRGSQWWNVTKYVHFVTLLK